MTKLVLEIPNQQDVELLLNFAKRLKANIVQIENSENQSAVHWLEKLANIDAFNDIEDPIEWQRNNRKERKLPFRT